MPQPPKPDEPLDLITAIQILALDSKENPTFESEVRRIQRWFSKEFSTSLLEVEKLPLEYILLHKFEHEFQSLSPEKFIVAKEHILLKKQILDEIEEDEAWVEAELKKAQQEMAEQTKKAAQAAAAKIAEEIAKSINLPPDVKMEFNSKGNK